MISVAMRVEVHGKMLKPLWKFHCRRGTGELNNLTKVLFHNAIKTLTKVVADEHPWNPSKGGQRVVVAPISAFEDFDSHGG